MQEAWEGFKEGIWTGEVDVRDFIQKNYTPYEGDESFLAGPTERTKELWGEVLDLLLKEREQGGVLDMDTKTVTGIVSHAAGYIDIAHREKETIVGLQTDKPLKRALHVNGGIRIACQAASQHGYKVDENVVERYTFERKTHNAGVFDVYTPEMRACRSAHIITGLPDGYGRFFTTRGKTRPIVKIDNTNATVRRYDAITAIYIDLQHFRRLVTNMTQRIL